MKLAIFGATGRIGLELVQRALAQGHEVTAVVRDPAPLAAWAERLEVIVASPLDGAAIAPSIKDRDVVLSALGPRPGAPAAICAGAATAICGAMRETGVRRLLVVSASGPYVDSGDDPLTRFVVKPILRRALRDGFADLRTAEEIVRASDLDWTLLRPSRLTGKPATGRVRRSMDRNLPLGMFTSRADVAVEMLRAMDDPATVGHTIAIAN
jgi:putative NADH-flavin reductase